MIYWNTKLLCINDDGKMYFRSPPYLKINDTLLMINRKSLRFVRKKIINVKKIRNTRAFRVKTENHFIDCHPVNYFVIKNSEGIIKLLRLSEVKKSYDFLFKKFNKFGKGYLEYENLLSVVKDTACSRFYDVVVDNQEDIDIFVANHFLFGVLRKG